MITESDNLNTYVININGFRLKMFSWFVQHQPCLALGKGISADYFSGMQNSTVIYMAKTVLPDTVTAVDISGIIRTLEPL